MGNMIPHPSAQPPMPAVALILSRYDRQKLANFIEVAIGLLDTMDGDTDAEPATWTEAGNRNTHADLPDDHEHSGDDQDISWTEWHSRDPRRHRIAQSETIGSILSEDDEEDDHAEDDDPDSEHDGSEPGNDDEIAQMQGDVPCIPVFSLEPNIFDGQRQLLGYTLPRPTRDGMEPEL